MPEFVFVHHRRVDRFLKITAENPTEAAKEFERFLSVQENDYDDDRWDEVDDSDEGDWEFYGGPKDNP